MRSVLGTMTFVEFTQKLFGFWKTKQSIKENRSWRTSESGETYRNGWHFANSEEHQEIFNVVFLQS